MPIHLNMFRLLSIRRETQWLKRGCHIIDQRCNIHDTNSDSHANAGLQNSDVICYSNSILQVIASCTHLTEFFLSPPSKDHRCFTLYYKFANVIHSMITGGPDVVNPYNFVEIFKSNHKSFDANECTYIL
jgi:ubiquitin C-terminal hydrolase